VLTLPPLHSNPRSATLATVLASAAAPADPPSPGSVASFATLRTATTADLDGADSDPQPPSQTALVEFHLLNLLLATLSGREPIPSAVPLAPSSPLPPLTVTLRDPVLPSSLPGLPSVSSPRSELGRKDPMVSMNALKAWLGSFAKARGWGEEAATAAIYGLVSKTVLRIDRRGREGPMLGFRN